MANADNVSLDGGYGGHSRIRAYDFHRVKVIHGIPPCSHPSGQTCVDVNGHGHRRTQAIIDSLMLVRFYPPGTPFLLP